MFYMPNPNPGSALLAPPLYDVVMNSQSLCLILQPGEAQCPSEAFTNTAWSDVTYIEAPGDIELGESFLFLLFWLLLLPWKDGRRCRWRGRDSVPAYSKWCCSPLLGYQWTNGVTACETCFTLNCVYRTANRHSHTFVALPTLDSAQIDKDRWLVLLALLSINIRTRTWLVTALSHRRNTRWFKHILYN